MKRTIKKPISEQVRVRPAVYARSRGLAKSTVARQIADGRISIGEDGLLNPIEADRQRKQGLDPGQALEQARRKKGAVAPSAKPGADRDKAIGEAKPVTTVGGDGSETWQQARTRREIAAANRAEMDLAVAEGKLFDADSICAHWAAVGTLVRDEVMALPTRIVNRLPDEWRRQVNLIVAEETRRALSAISHELSQPAEGAPGSK